jgi:hypothetical protein
VLLALLWAELLCLSAAALLGVFILNRELYAFFFRQRGFLFASACVPLHLLYYLCGGLSYLYVRIGILAKAAAKYRQRFPKVNKTIS